MGRRLILADGTKIENGEAGASGGMLWCYLPGWTVSRAARVFTDKKKTAEIYFQYGEMEDHYMGYTDCRNILTQDGQIAVCLTRGGT